MNATTCEACALVQNGAPPILYEDATTDARRVLELEANVPYAFLAGVARAIKTCGAWPKLCERHSLELDLELADSATDKARIVDRLYDLTRRERA